MPCSWPLLDQCRGLDCRSPFSLPPPFLLGLMKPEKFQRNFHSSFGVVFSLSTNNHYEAALICGLWSVQVHNELYTPGQDSFLSLSPPILGTPVADLPGKPFYKNLAWASSSPKFSFSSGKKKITIRSPPPQIGIKNKHETRWSEKHFLTQLCWCFP